MFYAAKKRLPEVGSWEYPCLYYYTGAPLLLTLKEPTAGYKCVAIYCGTLIALINTHSCMMCSIMELEINYV